MSKKNQIQTVAADKKLNVKALVIAIVCVVTALIIAASLTIALWPEADSKTTAPLDNTGLERSDATIANGDFEFVAESQTSYPKIAQDWQLYGHKTPTTSSQGYSKISTGSPTVMGIVDTQAEEWDNTSSDLRNLGVTVNNPSLPPDSDGSLVYMIHNTEQTAASIYSQGFSIPATTSVKISAWLKTVDASGAGAFVMIKLSSTSALEKSGETQNWYAHLGVVDSEDGINTNGQWQKFDFYVFNRSTSSKTVYFNTGLGNVYTDEGAEGTLFVDNVEYETVTSNEYREVITSTPANQNSFYVVDATSTSSDIEYLSNWSFSTLGSQVNQNVTEAQYLSNFTYMPAFEFVTDKDYNNASSNYIHSLSNDGTKNGNISASSQLVTVNPPATGSQFVLSVWVRVESPNKNVLPVANIYLVDNTTGKDLSSFEGVKTSDDLEEDINNGWAKYSFYVKPSDSKTMNLRLDVVFGDRGGYTNTQVIPDGKVYYTDLIVETITQSQYSSASTGTTAKKVSLNGTAGTTTVSNGSFSTYATNSNSTSNLVSPKDWTPVYAGANELYKKGEDKISVDTKYGTVESGVLLRGNVGPANDDEVGGVLQITNNNATSFGYLSSSFTLSAKTVYVISVLAKTNGGTPSIYLMDETADKILGKYEGVTSITNPVDSANLFLDAEADVNQGQTQKGGWVKYFFVIATGDTSITAKMALFNGKIDATETSGTSTGTVYFDRILVETMGTYVRDEATDDLWQKDDDDEFIVDDNGDYVIDQEALEKVTDTLASGYGKVGTTVYYEKFEELFDLISDSGNVRLVDFRFDLEYVTKPTESADDDTTDEDPAGNTVDWALLISIISSSLLLAALLIVVVVKFIFRRQRFDN